MRDKNNRVRPVNWNKVDDWHKLVWDTLHANFWVPERIEMPADLPSWRRLPAAEQTVFKHVFAGLTMLDTLQGDVGAVRLLKDARNPFQEAILANIIHMEQIHAQSYSNIFATLVSEEESDEAFEWAEDNKFLQYKQDTILACYEGEDSMKVQIASVFLESALFFSGFGLPFHYAGRGKLTNTADMIRLILRDEAIHGMAIGTWYQQALADETPERQKELREFTIELALDLYDNEEQFTRSVYDGVGLTDKILPYVQYNWNKAMQNLGYDSLFPMSITDIDPVLASSLSQSENGDFFSGATTYFAGKTEEVTDEDFLSMDF
jgi:ribonucleoside-diphosphate reductase beta chain